MDIADILLKTGCVKTKSAARRAVMQGAVRIDGIPIEDPFAQVWYDEDGALNITDTKKIMN